MALKLGRKPAKNAPALRFSAFYSGTTPAHPLAADHINIGGWQMLGNDQYGDCVAVTWANYRRLLTRLAGAERYPALDEVIGLYKTQNPGFPAQDDGMDIQTLLEYLVKTGEVIAFAKVDHTNPTEVGAAIAIFGALWVGINVTDANMAAFDHGQAWDYNRGARDEGGHSILYGAYNEAAGGQEAFVTWGQETFSTDAFWTHQVEEAWVVVWPENLGTPQFQQGVDVAALSSAFQQLTGKALDIPILTPPPLPAPPHPADIALWNSVRTWATAKHTGANATAARAVAAWANTLGLK